MSSTLWERRLGPPRPMGQRRAVARDELAVDVAGHHARRAGPPRSSTARPRRSLARSEAARAGRPQMTAPARAASVICGRPRRAKHRGGAACRSVRHPSTAARRASAGVGRGGRVASSSGSMALAPNATTHPKPAGTHAPRIGRRHRPRDRVAVRAREERDPRTGRAPQRSVGPKAFLPHAMSAVVMSSSSSATRADDASDRPRRRAARAVAAPTARRRTGPPGRVVPPTSPAR